MIDGVGSIQDQSWRGYDLPGDMGLIGSHGLWTSELLPDPDVPPDRAEDAQNKLLTQYDESPGIKAFLSALVMEMNAIEDVMSLLLILNDINLAAGTTLDQIGCLVGQDREGRSDAEYRITIKFKIFLNRSNGEPETIIAFAKYIIGSDDVRYSELYPGKILLSVKTGIILTPTIVDAIQKLALGGVEIITTFVPEGDDFGFDGEGGLPPDSTVKGFGEESLPVQKLFPDDNGSNYTEWGYIPGARPGFISVAGDNKSVSLVNDGAFYFPFDWDVQLDTIIEIDVEFIGGETDTMGIGFNAAGDTAPDAGKYFQLGGSNTFGFQDFANAYDFIAGGVQTISIPIGQYFVGTIDKIGLENITNPIGGTGIFFNVNRLAIHNFAEFAEEGGQFVEVFGLLEASPQPVF